jgi:diguanylate cyclase (GGDEF)-like protein
MTRIICGIRVRQSGAACLPFVLKRPRWILSRLMAQLVHPVTVAGPEAFLVNVRSELDETTLRRRGKGVNAILRLAMLAGLQMELDATLSTIADCMAEVVPHERMLVYFWEQEGHAVRVRLARGLQGTKPENYVSGNTFNVWASAYARPMLISTGSDAAADVTLQALNSGSALVLPIVIRNRVMGSVQLFAPGPHGFTPEDAQLLWIFCLVAENQLDREFAHEGLLKFAFTDYLTGLRTRGYFEQQLDLEIKRSERKRTPLSLLMLDIDYFKQLNDRCGHQVGDHVLRELASLLQREMRDLDTVARYGGEEFVVVLPETGTAGALHVAERLRQAVEQAGFAGCLQSNQQITISIGIAVLGRDTRFKRDLIHRADAALYRAKHLGRNQVAIHPGAGTKP